MPGYYLTADSYASSCFFAQQAAEKAAKGFLYSQGIRGGAKPLGDQAGERMRQI